jgi:hypothetical protein
VSQPDYLPERLRTVVSLAEQVLSAWKALQERTAETAPSVRESNAVSARVDEVCRAAETEMIAATYERYLLRRQIRDAESAERDLTMRAQGAAAVREPTADQAALAAIRNARTLRDDIAAWQQQLETAEEEVRQIEDVQRMMAQAREDLNRYTESLERRWRAAERSDAVAALIERLAQLDGQVRGPLTAQVREREAAAETHLEQAQKQDPAQILRARAYGAFAGDQAELDRLRDR